MEPGRKGKVRRGCAEELSEGVDLIAWGRLASSQLVHACAGNPVLFSKVAGQGSQAVDYMQATFEQGDLEDCLSIDGARAAIDPQLGLRRPFFKTHPSKTLPKPKTGRWRRAIPESWKVPMISTELEYSYDSMNDIPSFNPLYTEKSTRGMSRERTMMIV